MSELVSYAIKNIWCNSKQDNVYTFKPKRISPKDGSFVYCKVVERILDLPNKTSRFHVFQIGQLSPNYLNLFWTLPEWLRDTWINFTDSINSRHVMMHFYNDDGICIPSYLCYSSFIDERNLIIAIEQKKDLNIDYTGNWYIRTYQNTYFESDRYTGDVMLKSEGEKVTNIDSILKYQNKCIQNNLKTGYTLCYINGYLVNDINLITTKVGDYVEIIYDSSVKRLVKFNLNNLSYFTSYLDKTRKYVLHYEDIYNENTIEYFDDNEIYVIHEGNNNFKGTYLYRHTINVLRMITHRDYSLDVDVVKTQIDILKELLQLNSIENISLYLIIRESGYERPLSYEANCLHELMKLNDIHIREVLNSSANSISLWRSENLEASHYTLLMCEDVKNITDHYVKRALGYDAITSIFSYSPLYKDSNSVVTLPLLTSIDSTIYEYDGSGKLLGSAYNVEGQYYIPRYTGSVYYEVMRGKGTIEPDVYWSKNKLPYFTDRSYRIYMAHEVNGVLDNIWTELINLDLFTIVNNELIYKGDSVSNTAVFMLRTDKTFLAYDLNIKPVDGIIVFPLSEFSNRDGESKHYILPVPLGELDIFLNGRYLVPRLDYYINFPEVCIVNKEYLNSSPNTSFHHIHIRYRGLYSYNDRYTDTGFIEHGVLSNNNKFDLRDDRVLSIFVNGYFTPKENIVFSELHNGVSIINSKNGMPYSIRSIYVPLRDFIGEDTYELRELSIQNNKVISDYLTTKIPQPTRDALSAIETHHEIMSPFICKILFDIVTEHMGKEVYSKNLSDYEIKEICSPYEYLLKFDPITEANRPNMNFVTIHAHNSYEVMEVNLFAYRFLMRVAKIYSGELVNLSHFVAVKF